MLRPDCKSLIDARVTPVKFAASGWLWPRVQTKIDACRTIQCAALVDVPRLGVEGRIYIWPFGQLRVNAPRVPLG
jgi:hypothetical protein